MSGPEFTDIGQAVLAIEAGRQTVKAAASWLKDQIHERKYGINTNPEEFRRLGEIEDSQEFEDLAQYASGRERRLIRLGLRLRQLEGDDKEVAKLKNKIRSTWTQDAVFLAQAVGTRAVTGIRHILVDHQVSQDRIEEIMEDVLQNARKYVYLVTQEVAGAEAKEAEAIHANIRREEPPVFATAGSGRSTESAAKIAKELDDRLMGREALLKEGVHKKLFFFVDPVNIGA